MQRTITYNDCVLYTYMKVRDSWHSDMITFISSYERTVLFLNGPSTMKQYFLVNNTVHTGTINESTGISVSRDIFL